MSSNAASAALHDVDNRSHDARPRNKREHLLISLFWLATNFHWGALLFILLPGDIALIRPESRAQWTGYVTGLGALFALVVPLVVGALSDRSRFKYGRRRPFMVAGVLLNLVGLGIMAAAVAERSLALYIAGFLSVQFGNNVATAAYMGVIPDLVIKEEHGIASGFMALMSQLGTLLGAMVVGRFLGDAPVFLRYQVVGAVLLVLLVVTLFGIDETRYSHNFPRINWKEYIKSLWIDPRKYPNFAWVWITRFLVMLGFYAIMPQLKYYLIDVIGIPIDKVDAQAPLLLGVILIVSSFSGYFGGAISDRIGRRKMVYIANSFIAVVVLGFIFAKSVETAIIVGAIFGIGYGAYISVDYALGTDVLPSHADAGKDMAVWHVAMTLPQSLTGAISGLLVALPGKTLDPINKYQGEPLYHYKPLGFALIFILCSICFAAGAFLLRNLRGIR